MLSAASSYEVNSLAGLQDFDSELIAQERRNHHIVERIFLGPQLVIGDVGIGVNEKFPKGVIDLSLDHPGFDHCEHRS